MITKAIILFYLLMCIFPVTTLCGTLFSLFCQKLTSSFSRWCIVFIAPFFCTLVLLRNVFFIQVFVLELLDLSQGFLFNFGCFSFLFFSFLFFLFNLLLLILSSVSFFCLILFWKGLIDTITMEIWSIVSHVNCHIWSIAIFFMFLLSTYQIEWKWCCVVIIVFNRFYNWLRRSDNLWCDLLEYSKIKLQKNQ